MEIHEARRKCMELIDEEMAFWVDRGDERAKIYSELRDIVNDCMKKQIAKPVIKVKTMHPDYGSPYRCKACEASLVPIHFFPLSDEAKEHDKYSWCDNCGQKIDWSHVFEV